MKRFLLPIFLALLLLACSRNMKQNQLDDSKSNLSLTTYSFKVVGLNDSIVSDSLWKMIFTMEEIDQMLLQKEDSMLIISVNSEELDKASLIEEITNRGAIVLP